MASNQSVKVPATKELAGARGISRGSGAGRDGNLLDRLVVVLQRETGRAGGQGDLLDRVGEVAGIDVLHLVGAARRWIDDRLAGRIEDRIFPGPGHDKIAAVIRRDGMGRVRGLSSAESLVDN